jgi:hypothetical protein
VSVYNPLNSCLTNYPGPGQLVVKNNSIIEYAEKAIFSDLNGVVKVTDSKFSNCPIGVELSSYREDFLIWSTLPNLKPRAYIYRSEFETNNKFINAPIAHVRIINVDKISLKGNVFVNTITDDMLLGQSRGTGIYAMNSSFSVNEYCPYLYIQGFPCGNATISSFTGLYYGIWVENPVK